MGYILVKIYSFQLSKKKESAFMSKMTDLAHLLLFLKNVTELW